MTLSELKIGSVVAYNDMANFDEQYVVLNSYEDQFGKWVDMLHKSSNTVAPHTAKTKIDNVRWSIVAQPE